MNEEQINNLTRADRDIIASIIPPGAHVLDLGCGDGGLLAELIEKKEVVGRGIDIDENNIIRCIEQGLSVCIGDIDKGLTDYPNKSYDFVVLNQTLQVIKKPDTVIREMLRVGKHAIVGFPNFGHWALRLKLLITGKMPKSKSLPFRWYNTPNIHQLTIRDFRDFSEMLGAEIIREEYFIFGKWRYSKLIEPFANMFGVTGMFVLREKKG